MSRCAWRVAALVLAFATTLGRSLFLTAWAYRHGPAAIDGPVHDATGYAVLGFTVVGLFCLLPLLNLRLGGPSKPKEFGRGEAASSRLT